MGVTVEDYEAFYRLWLPIELELNMDGVGGAQSRAHARALAECALLPQRQADAQATLEIGKTPPPPPQAGGNRTAASTNGRKRGA
jgi:hypothetical protein